MKAEPVVQVDDAILKLARDMLDTMYGNSGIGLAAEQVGRREAMFVVDVPTEATAAAGSPPMVEPEVEMPLVMINPRLLEMNGEQTGQEGCLSFPEIFVDVKRAEEITVSFTDLKNETRALKVRGLLARAVQHETDHLNGILLVDRMSPVQKAALSGRLKRLRKSSRSR